jgi:N-acetylglucosaminyldiphosphoundecaprenol N-acetyl-beta-D-mannosaminyltransferase
MKFAMMTDNSTEKQRAGKVFDISAKRAGVPQDAELVENRFESPESRDATRSCPSVSILGVPVSLITLENAVSNIMGYIEKRQAQYVCVRDVYSLMCAVQDPENMRINRKAAMVTPDGMPLVWVSRWRTNFKTGRVSGADLVDSLCCAGQTKNLRHYFYGGKAGVAETMIAKLQAKYPKMSVAGFYSPPFRPLTDEEDKEIVDHINESGAQVVWVGVGTPKQEIWMRDHVGLIKGATLIGVGAAFDFQSGAVARAPKWMQKSGLEWLHRLLSEPRRLGRRYFIIAPLFSLNVICEQIKLYFARIASSS